MYGTRRTLISGLALAVLGVVLAQAPAHAERFDLSIGSTVRYARSASVDALSADDAHSFFSLIGAVRLDRPLIPGFDLFLEGTFETGSIEGTSLRRIDSSTGITGAMVGGRVQRSLPRRITGFARVGFGMSKMSLSLTDRLGGAATLRDSAYVGTTYVAAGLEFLPIRRRDAGGAVRFAMGLRVEVGYLASTSAEMYANPENDGDDSALRIPTAPASLGTLDASGRTYRVGLVGRF